MIGNIIIIIRGRRRDWIIIIRGRRRDWIIIIRSRRGIISSILSIGNIIIRGRRRDWIIILRGRRRDWIIIIRGRRRRVIRRGRRGIITMAGFGSSFKSIFAFFRPRSPMTPFTIFFVFSVPLSEFIKKKTGTLTCEF
jgi:hypothetical protein